MSKLYPEQYVGEKTWLSWPLVSSLLFTSMALAATALILSIKALRHRPRRLYPLAFAIFALCVCFFILL